MAEKSFLRQAWEAYREGFLTGAKQPKHKFEIPIFWPVLYLSIGVYLVLGAMDDMAAKCGGRYQPVDSPSAVSVIVGWLPLAIGGLAYEWDHGHLPPRRPCV